MAQNETNAKFSHLPKPLRYMGLMLLHLFSKAKLQRIPEPSTLTEQTEHVEEYSRAIDTVMILPYILVLDMVHRLMGAERPAIKAIDLCCGPGHFTRMLAKNLKCDEVIGIDLSEPMLKKARENAKEEMLSSKTKYLKSDVADLKAIPSKSMDLVSFMDGAHHMGSLQQVTKILEEADRVCKPDGAIVILDPVRPKTQSTANLYFRIAGEDYVQKNMPHFNKDFQDSLFASWSQDELFQAIPQNTKRRWVQLNPFGFPAFQIIIGLPEGQAELVLSEGLSRSLVSRLVPKSGKGDWQMLKLSFKMASKRTLPSNEADRLNG